MDRRLRWKTADSLRRMSDLEARGLDTEEMVEGYGLLRRDLPVLNAREIGYRPAGTQFRYRTLYRGVRGQLRGTSRQYLSSQATVRFLPDYFCFGVEML